MTLTVKLSGPATVKLRTARVLKKMKLIRGGVVNIDVHITEYFGKERLPKGQHGTTDKAVRCWATLVARIRKRGIPSTTTLI